MTTALSTVQQSTLTRDQVDLLKRTICQGASDDELALFVQVCRGKRLDPFSGQIHAVKRKEWDAETRTSHEKMTYQTGIDGFRVIAQRTGERDGEDAPEWCGDDGVWTELWTRATPPKACRFRIYRKGHSRPYVGLAYWDMYVQTKKDGTPNRMWSRGGAHMLAKCAEALALRKAFPDELGDLHTPEELPVEHEPVGATFAAPPQTAAISAAQPKALAEPTLDRQAIGMRLLEATTLDELDATKGELMPDIRALPKSDQEQLRELYTTHRAQVAGQ